VTPDAAGDPDLPAGAFVVAEPAERPADHRGHAGPHDIRELRGPVAQRLDGEVQDLVVRGAGDREGMPVPAVLAFQEEMANWPGANATGRPSGTRPISVIPGLTSRTLLTW
jgi:hypothetical protein